MSGAWGRLPAPPPAAEWLLADRHAPLPDTPLPLLAQGNGRSYGDVALNDGGAILHTRRLDRYIAFDAANGILRAEAGVLLADVIAHVLPQGWFPPVTPGTRYVTLGGALANDVHGKNHHAAGTFGDHVRCFELLRSDGQRLRCAPDENRGLFAATIGGLGLTGLVTWVELQLRPLASAWIDASHRRFHGLEEFFALNREAEAAREHVVAWIDCLASRPRGILIAGDHADAGGPPPEPSGGLAVPFTPPVSAINGVSLRAFNTAYFHRPLPPRQRLALHPFFYPLDGLRDWNRLYGPRGFYQYQCVIPVGTEQAMGELLATIRDSGQGSFLAVIKTFGDRPPPGMLSFPRAGTNLALDFPNRGAATHALFARLDAIVAAAGGRLYPAKDARMPGTLFRSGYPRLTEFMSYVDPRFSSSFWRRVNTT